MNQRPQGRADIQPTLTALGISLAFSRATGSPCSPVTCVIREGFQFRKRVLLISRGARNLYEIGADLRSGRICLRGLTAAVQR